jgi:hypothetical protein
MKAPDLDITFKVIFSRAIFESTGFFFGFGFGFILGFLLGFVYPNLPMGAP